MTNNVPCAVSPTGATVANPLVFENGGDVSGENPRWVLPIRAVRAISEHCPTVESANARPSWTQDSADARPLQDRWCAFSLEAASVFCAKKKALFIFRTGISAGARGGDRRLVGDGDVRGGRRPNGPILFRFLYLRYVTSPIRTIDPSNDSHSPWRSRIRSIVFAKHRLTHSQIPSEFVAAGVRRAASTVASVSF